VIGKFHFSVSTLLSLIVHFYCLRQVPELTQTQDVLPSSSKPSDLKDAVQGELLHRTQHKVDSINVINAVRIQPLRKSRLLVPLCRMVAMAKVRPVGEMGVQHLEREFVKGYRDGDRVMYISMFNTEEMSMDVTEEMKAKWSPCWRRANEAFEADLQGDDDLNQFSGKMFFVWEGNHRLSAWLRHINKHHADDPAWHISVHCIILDPRGQVGNLLHAMHDINW
jgi:hypothetical protein